MRLSGTVALLDYWVVGRPMEGECASGDQYLIADFPGGVLIAVADGLGHGPDAAAAAGIALTALAEHASDPVVSLVQRCHEALKGTRGVVLSVASFDAANNAMTWLGIGNVEGMLVCANQELGDKHASLLLRGGIVGDCLPPLLPATLSIHPGDLLIFATDGIHHTFMRDICFTKHPQELIDRLFTQYGKSNDDALLLGARWKNGDLTPHNTKG